MIASLSKYLSYRKKKEVVHMTRLEFKKEKPFCLNLQKKVNVIRYYQQMEPRKTIRYKQECEHHFDCKECTNCVHAFHPIGSEFLQG